MISPSRDDVALVDFEDQSVLFCEGQQRLYALDPLAAALWSALAGGRAENEAVRLLIEQANLSPAEAEDHIAASLALWDELGLLRKDETIATRPAAPPVNKAPEGPQHDVFSFSGFRVGIGYGDPDVTTAVRDVFGHLSAGEANPDFAFTVACEAGGYRLLGPDGADYLLTDCAAVAVWLKTEILDAHLRRSPATIAIHAAALGSPNGTVLLVGPSGCGKTTIAALLNAHGWSSIADDVVLIDCHPRGIRGLPLAYALKPGSWPVVARARPLLGALHSCRRPDGRTVKYLCPTSIAAHPAPAAAMVFPRFAEGAPTMMIPVPRAQALADILAEARSASEYLTVEAFLAVASVVGQATVHELRFGRAEEACAMLLRRESAAETNRCFGSG